MAHEFSDTLCSASEWTARCELAAAYQLASYFKWTDLIYTHISLRVPNEENTLLINPFGLHFHEITPESLVKIDDNGNIVSDTPYSVNPAGIVMHTAIHKARPDLQAIVHLHTINGMAISAVKEGLLPISQQACHFYGKIAYHDYEGIVVDDNEQETIVRDLGDKDIMILRNHGFLTAGQSIAEAFTRMYTLEKAAEVQRAACEMGLTLVIPSTAVCERVVRQTGQKGIKVVQTEWEALKRLL